MNTKLLILFAALWACESDHVEKKDNNIRYKENIKIHDVPAATLTFFEVSDSRCPEGVQCIWAGNATVDLALESVNTEGKLVEHINLCLGDCRTLYGPGSFRQVDSLDKHFAGESYRFILEKVNPAPKADSVLSKKDYTITLRVEKK